MAHEHKHGPHCNHSHDHGHHHHHHHNHNHNHAHTFTDHHKHGPNCKHKHDNKSVHYSHGEHAADCEHKNHEKCNHGHDKYNELTAKDYEKRRRKRQLRQWARRGNHTLQNCIAAIWIWTLSESSLRYYYENNMYDQILIFHGLQILSLCLFFWSSLSEPGFLSSNTFPNKNLKKNEDEVVSLLSHDVDIEANNSGVKQIDPNGETPPSFCRSCKFLRPLRAKHCYMCDRCVPRFDHHCPLIEQCVGAKNYRQFYILCWSQLMVSGWSFLIAIDCLFYSESSDRSNIGWIWRILLFLWMLYQSFMAMSLVSFHSYLVCTQQTTYEFLKPRKLKQRLNYEQQNASTLSGDILADRTVTHVQARRRGIPGPWVLMRKMCIGMGFCLCDYPFSQGLIRNWYGFITADCLERPEYFQTEPVILIQSPPKQDSEANDKALDITQDKGTVM